MPEGEFTPPTPPQTAPPPVYTPLPPPPTVRDRSPDGLPLSGTPQEVIDARAARSAARQADTSTGAAVGGARSTAPGHPSVGRRRRRGVRTGAPRLVAWNMRALLHETTRMLPRGRIAYF